jgi:hypothetical protein
MCSAPSPSPRLSADRSQVPSVVRLIVRSACAVLGLDEADADVSRWLSQMPATAAAAADDDGGGGGGGGGTPADAAPRLGAGPSRWAVLWVLLTVFTSGGRYDARMRAFLVRPPTLPTNCVYA